jgi:hypothetical protein
MAVILGLAVYMLWRQNRELRTFYEGDPKEPERKPGRIAELVKSGQTREDDIRQEMRAALSHERNEQKQVMDELLKVLKGDPS